MISIKVKELYKKYYPNEYTLILLNDIVNPDPIIIQPSNKDGVNNGSTNRYNW